MKTIFYSLILLVVFFAVSTVNAQTDPPTALTEESSGLSRFIPCSGVDCNACHVVKLVNELIIWLFGIIFLLFAVLMMYAGFGLVTSGGNPAALQSAKSMFTNALIGLLIVMSAWLIVDTIMQAFVGGGGGEDDAEAGELRNGWGPWAEIECKAQTPSTPVVGGGNNGGGNNGGGGVIPVDPNNPPDGRFTYQSGIAGQIVHASPKLVTTLDCMAGKVPGNVGEISSISDSLILSGQKTWEQCRQRPQQCAHVPSSYHYGNNGICGNQSYAVDFGDEQNATVLCNAARSCGQIRVCSVHNGNHVHMEVTVSPC